QKRFPEAEALYDRAVSITEENFGRNHINLASFLNNLARLLVAQDKLTEAEPLLRRQLQIAFLYRNQNGVPYKHETAAIQGYAQIATQLGRSGEEIKAMIAGLKREAGVE
ncbi:MAG: tetratricopeptide repeat protein, partial [Akkermansiaceae bacterium]|nr:tetratricopeptide repeat protein [Akkermansiaceae bacterium]